MSIELIDIQPVFSALVKYKVDGGHEHTIPVHLDYINNRVFFQPIGRMADSEEWKFTAELERVILDKMQAESVSQSAVELPPEILEKLHAAREL